VYVVWQASEEVWKMTRAQRMIETNPSGTPVDAGVLSEAIDSCFECAQTCTACADACLGEDDPKSLTRCIRLDLDCADICDATGRILSRQSGFEPQLARSAVEACARAAKLCGDECEKHAGHHGHCRVCLEACRRCEEACNSVLSAMPA
jgi:hypothetical protein